MNPQNIYVSVPMFVNADPGIEECPGVLMALDAPTIKTLISRIEMVNTLKQQDPDVFALARHNFSVTIFDRSAVSDFLEDADLFDEGVTELTEEQYNIIAAEEEKGNTQGFDEDKGASIRAECRQEHYMEDAVYYTAIVKHTSIEMESTSLGLETLRGYLARLEAK